MKRDAWDEARTHLHEACEVRPHSSEAWYASAVCSLHLEQEEQALTDLRRVVSLDPQHPQAWASLAALFARSKQRKEALFAYRAPRYLVITPSSARRPSSPTARAAASNPNPNP